jgi:Spy/CpxP family protein refolding chaperone
MKTKIILLTLFFIASVAIGNVALAQTPPTQAPVMLTPQQKLEKRLDHVAKRLKLTQDQTAKLRSIWESDDPKIQADRAAIEAAARGTDARKDAREQLAADLRARNGQIKSILTPEQFHKLKRMRLLDLERRDMRLQREERRLRQ